MPENSTRPPATAAPKTRAATEPVAEPTPMLPAAEAEAPIDPALAELTRQRDEYQDRFLRKAEGAEGTEGSEGTEGHLPRYCNVGRL